MKPVTSLVLCCLLLIVPMYAASAQQGSDWLESRTQDFAIIYPTQYEMLGQAMFSLYGTTLDSEYQRFAGFFGASLQLPISIRIYPDIDEYKTLNAVAPELLPEGTHSHIGSREIALIGENIARNLDQWQLIGLDAFRYELAILFTEQLSAGKAPPGLLGGVGGYAQEPANLIEITRPAQQTELATWRKIWDSPNLYQDAGLLLQATSITAYLVDIYGWPKLLSFLSTLAISEDYRRAISQVYGVEPNQLEEEWRQYYPLYLQGRWRAHALYDFDLAVFEKLVAAGAYADAEQGLREAIQFLEKAGAKDKQAQAAALLEKARIGQEAGALLVQARQALQNGEYGKTVELTNQAEQKYQQVDGRYRLEELAAYRERAQEISGLQGEVKQLSAQFSLNPTDKVSAVRLAEISLRLGELGDIQAQAEINALLEKALQSQRRMSLWIAMLGAGLALGLLLWRILLVRRSPPAEAQI